MADRPFPTPNLIDRVVAAIDPAAGVRRMVARATLTAASGFGYRGGKYDRRDLSEWTPLPGGPDLDTLFDLPGLRARGRDASRNDSLAAGAVGTMVSNVVGTGLDALPRVDREVLDLTDEEADRFERDAYRFWRIWAASKNADVAGRHDFYGLQDLALRSALDSGDVLAIRRFKERKGELYGTRLQLIEADRIATPDGQADSAKISGGVELDEDGRIVKVYVRNGHPGEVARGASADDTKFKPVPLEDPETGAALALFLFKATRIGQRRGVPFLAPVIETLKTISKYREAELRAALVSALFTAFIKTQAGESLSPVDAEREAQDPTQAKEYRLGSGAILDLMPNEDVVFANPARPNAQFDPFWQAVVNELAIGLGLPYEVLVKRFQSSYSASRAALLEAWKLFRGWRAWLAKDFCQPAYEWVIEEAILRGYLTAPGFDDPIKRRAYLNCVWQGDAPGSVDPVKEVTAAEKRVAGGFSTIEEETTLLTGGDWLSNHRQRVKEVKMRRDAGLDVEPTAERVVTKSENPPGKPGGAPPAPPAEPAKKRPDDGSDDDTEEE